MCLSRFHLPVPLGSTGISRFVATMGTLTPEPLLPAPTQVSLVHGHALPDIPPPPTPCASAPAWLRFPGRLGPRFASSAIGGASDFAHCSQSRQSHKAVSSLCRSPRRAAILRTVRSLSVALHAASPGRSYFRLSGGKHRQGGTLTLLCAFAPKRTGGDDSSPEGWTARQV